MLGPMDQNTYTGRSVRAEVSVLFWVFAIENVEFQAVFEAKYSEQVLAGET